MKKRFLAFLLAAVLCLGLIGAAGAVSVDPDYGPQAPTQTPVDPPKPPVDPGTSDTGSDSGSRSNITIRNGGASHGYVSCSPSDAKQGDTVTVTARPKDGYRADSIIVRDSKGNEIEVKRTGDNKFTFVMPAGRVTVTPVFVRIQGEKPAAATGFVDVPADAYYADAVAWAVEQGITTGTTATTFSPNASCTRAQTVTFLWRAAGSPAPKSETNPFTDVDSGTYYYQAVLWAVEQGITTGTSASTFSPNATVTRAQTVTFLYRAAGSPAGGSSNPFTDVASGAYYDGAVLWAVEKGITSGTTATTFSPSSDCTRAQIVTFLYRAQ